MSKPNNIRKKALEYAKKRQWDKALTEFSRLVEIEQHNPNVFNEIGDIQLKLGNKREAFKRYHEAIDAYAKVGLHNNAVAVCKKILRLNPNDVVVYGKMAMLRKRQGFEREAVDYSATFLESLQAAPDSANDSALKLILEIVETFDGSAEVLERAADALLAAGQNAEAGPVLETLGRLHAASGMSDANRRAREKMASIGYVPEEAEPAGPDKLETVETHRENRPAAVDLPFNGKVPPHIRREREGDGSDFGTIEIGAQDADIVEAPVAEPTGERAAETECGAEPAGERAAETAGERISEIAAGPRAEEPAAGPKEYVIPEIPDGQVPETASAGAAVALESEGRPEAGEESNPATDSFTAELAAEVKADIDDGDHRSHYDLGMAYLEMGLHADAIREFQTASTSPAYQVRSLEMIGHCLINQGQPRLAVKQLTKGLALIAGDDRASLGLKYNLGIAYEMIGEEDKAKTLFEDVYVVDITFRDVQDRMKKYGN